MRHLPVKSRKSSCILRGTSLSFLAASAALGCSIQTSEGEADEISTVHQETFGPLGSTEPVQIITTLTQLRQMQVSGNYRLGANINASATSTVPFEPIGTPWAPFTGTLDGNGYTISNLHIDPSTFGAPYTGMWTGLIGKAITALIKDVKLTNVDVRGDDYTGALVGSLSESVLTGCSVTGVVSAINDSIAVGLVVGQSDNSNLTRSSAVGTVTGGGRTIGGFVGEMGQSYGELDEVSEIFTNVTVKSNRSSGTVQSGGLAGKVTGVAVYDINVVGSVQGRNRVGGIVGYVAAPVGTSSQWKAVLQRTLFRGDVTDSASSVDRAGSFGSFQSGAMERCDTSYWDKSADDGTTRDSVLNQDTDCSVAFDPSTLIFPYDTAQPHFYPFFSGQGPITQAQINMGLYSQCYLHGGSDGDWGFGYCASHRHRWSLNADDEHISLIGIPVPSIQPLQAGLGSCTPESATSLGTLNNGAVTVPANACVQFSDYPSWASSIDLQIQGVTSATNFRWVNCDNSQAETANVGTTEVTIPFDDSCTTVVKFQGSGSSNIVLDTWGNP